MYNESVRTLLKYGRERTVKMSDKIFRLLSADRLIPDPYQPRRHFDEKEIDKLAESILSVGIIHPLTVAYSGNGGYRIISGERRYRAAAKAGVKEIPCLVVSVTEEEAAVMTVTENLQRRDLNCFEQANGIMALMKGLNLTQEAVAAKLGISQSAVANKLRLLHIPHEVQEYLIENKVGERQARALLSLETSECESAARYIVENKMNSSGAEEFVAGYLKSKKKKTRAGKMRGYCGDVRLYINSLNHTLGLMKSSGLASDSKKEEYDDRVVYTFVINKATG